MIEFRTLSNLFFYRRVAPLPTLHNNLSAPNSFCLNKAKREREKKGMAGWLYVTYQSIGNSSSTHTQKKVITKRHIHLERKRDSLFLLL